MNTRNLALSVLACAMACSQPATRSIPSPSPQSPSSASATDALPSSMIAATATLHDLAGARVGTVTFTDSFTGVIVSGNLTALGLGAHGIHIHAVGKCVAPFASAGGHFNPEQRQHGFLNPKGSHLGDLPNIDTPAAGNLRFEFLLPGVTLTGNNKLLDEDGASVVIHSARDDYTSDPSGNSGGRIACGVIQAK